MAGALPLRAALKRGALVTLANWPIIVVDFTIESLYKMALAVPIVGGAFMMAVLVGADVRGLFSEGVRSAAELVMASLVSAPVALASFVLSVAVVLVGGAIVMLLVKMGTLAVLVAGERAAQDIDSVPLKFESFRRAYAYGVPVLLDASRRFRHRAATLVIGLSAAYALIGALYLAAMAWAIQLTSGPWSAAWPLVVLLSTSAGIVAVALVNLVYDLVRIIVVAEDCGVVAALARLRSFLIHDARQVIGLFGVVGALLTLATAASLLATAGLALVAWVPVIGLIVVPLQAAAWIVRGLAFQYMGLASLCAYQTQYRRFREPGDSPVSIWVQRA